MADMMIGYALCGSFCTHKRSLEVMESLIASGHELLPIVSETVAVTDTRFGRAYELEKRIFAMCGMYPLRNIVSTEPLGPDISLDALIISPCTGNTLAKLATGITDTSVTMAAKAHLRSDRPLVIALASNDAMSANLKNIAAMLNRKKVYFVPMKQDDVERKPHSLVADFSLVGETLELALEGKQLRPLFLG